MKDLGYAKQFRKALETHITRFGHLSYVYSI